MCFFIIDEGIEICVNEEHSPNENPIDVTDDGVSKVICTNDEHPVKAESPIEVTDERIEISVNCEHPERAKNPIDVIDDGFVICLNDEHI